MAKKKQKKNELVSDLAPAFEMAGGSLAASTLAPSFDQFLPAGVSNPLTTTGRVTSQFVAPVAVLGATNITLKQLKKAEKKMKGGIKK